ncbi:MAG: elongation factor EF-2 [Candidatus Woesearchaeota archaeon]|nr:elongation factor EF-2 [Candidatus Woesearchaeota archaeon]
MADTPSEMKELAKVPEHIRNICTSAHIHHGKTALTDNLLAASGHISSKAAGDLDAGMATWQHADEQERLMTVDAANVSMCHTFNGSRYLINLIDTPGHVDFGGNVTRAMRAIDGTIVLICAVEGIMPQTETVVRQAIRERVKPVLFINKVDRLINELKFTPEQMQERFLKLIMEFNTLIENTAEDEYKEKWKVDILNGSVAFGSARENWALSVPYMKNKNVSFKDIVNLYKEDVTEENRQKWIWEKAPVFEVILDMVIKHLPNPLEAQKYRIPHIWHGDLETQFGKDLLVGNPNGKIAFVITRITIDPRFGRELCAGRLFSGTVRAGQTVWLNNAKSTQRIAQVFMYKGIKPESLESVPAGNVLALGGISGMAGETITEGPEQPFEELKHIFEPVITKSIEPIKPQDLPKLVEVLKKVLKEDPSIKIDINQETGENLIHGMGELHLEIIENRIKTEKGLDIKTSPPIVVYRESMQKPGQEMEGKSPNKHNKFYIVCEPLEENVHAAIKKGDIPEGRVSKKDTRLYAVLEKLGWSAKEAKKVRDVYNGNLLIDDTRGIVYIGEVQELINDGYEQVMKQGPIAREPVIKLKVIVKDCKLHEDSIHRGPAQVVPAIREAIRGSMNSGNAIIYEPLQVLQIDAPADYMGEISKLVQNKRGQLLNVKQEGTSMSIRAKLPVAESLGLASDLRSATGGRGSYFLVDQMFERLPGDLQPRVAQRIRERKGLKIEEETPSE